MLDPHLPLFPDKSVLDGHQNKDGFSFSLVDQSPDLRVGVGRGFCWPFFPSSLRAPAGVGREVETVFSFSGHLFSRTKERG